MVLIIIIKHIYRYHNGSTKHYLLHLGNTTHFISVNQYYFILVVLLGLLDASDNIEEPHVEDVCLLLVSFQVALRCILQEYLRGFGKSVK